jgi:hypothetical protein
MTVIQMSGQELTRLRIMIDVADGRLTVESAASLKVWGGSRAEAARSIKHAALHSQGNLARSKKTCSTNLPANTVRPSVPIDEEHRVVGTRGEDNGTG